MSVFATADVVVHLHKFRNIDLYARGVYAVRCSVTVDNSNASDNAAAYQTAGDWSDPLCGIPYTSFSKAKSHSTFVRQQEIANDDVHNLPQAKILDDVAMFQTRAFVIKYRDEYLELNEGAQFQLLIPMAGLAEQQAQRMKISVQLMMAELEKQAALGAKVPDVAAEKVPMEQNFQKIAEQEFIVSVDSSWSVHEYFPATFDDLHFVQLDMSVHAAMINMKFRRRAGRQANVQRSGLSRQATDASTFRELLFPAAKYEDLDPDHYQSTMESATEAICDHYVQPMTDSMDCTTEAFRWLWDECLPPDFRYMSDADLGFSRAKDSKPFRDGREAVDALPAAPDFALFNAPSQGTLGDVLLTALQAQREADGDAKSPSPPSLMQWQQAATRTLEDDISQAAKFSFQLWSRFVALLPEAHERVHTLLRPAWLTNARRLWFSRAKLEFRRAQKILQGEAASALSAESQTMRREIGRKSKLVRKMMDAFDRKLLGNLDSLPICLFFKYVSYAEMRKVEDDELMRNSSANVPSHNVHAHAAVGGAGAVGGANGGAAGAAGADAGAAGTAGAAGNGPAAGVSLGGPALDGEEPAVPLAIGRPSRRRKSSVRSASLAPVVNTSTTLSSRQFGRKNNTRPLKPSSRAASLPNTGRGGAVPRPQSKDDAAASPSQLGAANDPSAGGPGTAGAANPAAVGNEAATPAQAKAEAPPAPAGGGGGTGGGGSFFSRLAAGLSFQSSSNNNEITEMMEGDGGMGAASSTAHPFAELLANEDSTAPHVFVLHHGFHGTSYDLRLIRSYLLLLFPNALVLASQVNEENSDVSIATMGKRLAAETRNFIMHKVPDMAAVDFAGRLSFIGHSVGSVVIRAALQSPLLRVFANKMHAFVSLSSPHLGNTYVPSAVVSAGMWALKRLRKADVLEELQMLDATDPEDTLLYRLSLDRGLTNFKHVILVSGHQDQYVPLYSALIQVPRDAERDVNGGPTVISMAANLMGSLEPSRVIRVNMDHYFDQVTMDTLIGRAAHVTLLDSHAIIQMLLFSLYNVLQ